MVDKMAPQFLEVPGRAAEQGVDAIPDFSEQIVTIHAVVVLRVSNHRLNRRAPFEQFAQLRGKIPPSGDVNRDRLRMIAWPAKALINKRFLGSDSRYPLDLSQGRFQGCSIIGIIVGGIDPD